MSRPSRFLAIPLLLCASGLVALVYQSVWLRSLGLIFGASTPATGAVLAFFMAGLGFGSYLLGRRAERHANPLRLYARLEAAAAVLAAVSPWLLDGARQLYVLTGGASATGEAGAALLRLLLAAAVIGPPAFLMGGTLPAAARAFTAPGDEGRRGVALLYGLNTLGATMGALIATFFAFEAFGTKATLWAACVLNLAVAGAAWWLSRGPSPFAAVAAVPEPEPVSPAVQRSGLSRVTLLASAFITGFTFFLAEIVWYRMTSPILGGSVYTFGLVLALALLGIGVGALLYGARRTREVTAGRLGLTCALQGAFILVPLALGDRVAELAVWLRAWSDGDFSALVAGWLAVAAIVVFPASVVAGYQFPVMIALAGRGSKGVAAQVGDLYAANTLGAILGSLAGGFLLLPLLTAPGAWRLCVLLLLALGLVLALQRLREERIPALVTGGVCAACAAALALSTGPTAFWRHDSVGAGRSAFQKVKTENQRRDYLHEVRRQTLREIEGRESSLAFVASNGLSLVVNGKSDGNAVGDGTTAVLLGQLGALLHEAPKTACVIGLGSGETAGWLAPAPSLRRVDVVELEPGVLEFARACSPANNDALSQEKIKIHIGDGREFILSSGTPYDLIVSEPSNPYRAGVAGFFTLDFYRQAARRLAPRGILLQWLQGYELGSRDFALALRTFHRVFPNVGVWRIGLSDFLLLGSMDARDQAIDTARVRARLWQEPFRSGFGRIAGVFEPEGLLSLYVGGTRFVEALIRLHPEEENTDDRNLLEYRLARMVGVKERVALVELLTLSRSVGDHRPVTVGPGVDWPRVDDLRSRWWLMARVPPPAPLRPTGGPGRFWAAWLRGALPEAARLISELETPPYDLFERLAVAQARAATPYSAQFTPEALDKELSSLASMGFGGDVAWIRLFAALVNMRHSEAPELARLAFAAAGRDPWINGPYLESVLHLLRMFAKKNAPLAAALVPHLLEHRFAVEAHAAERERTLLALALSSNKEDLMLKALELLEPYPLWWEPFLKRRAELYQRAAHPRAERAARDLLRFRQTEGAATAQK